MTAEIKQQLRVEVHKWQNWPTVLPLWKELSERSPHTTFFLTPAWVEAWIEVFGELLQPDIAVFRTPETCVGACLLVHRNDRRGPFQVRRVYLNTAGEEDLESACIEFNSLLCSDGWEETVASA